MIRATIHRNSAYTVWLPLLIDGTWRRYTRKFIGVAFTRAAIELALVQR